MRTVATLCASGAGIGIASIGLAVVRDGTPAKQQPSSGKASPGDRDMTAVATYARHDLDSPFALSTPPPLRTASEGHHGKARSGNARVGQKRILTPRASFSRGMERPPEHDDDGGGGGGGGGSRAVTPNSQRHAWLRRLSSSLSTSRDSFQTPSSRPASAAVSHSNGSGAFSHSGSTTPIFPHDPLPTLLPPNKLVKRVASPRHTNGSPSPTSGSRLPLPVLRRPATSHQRSATLQEMFSGEGGGDRRSVDRNPSPSSSRGTGYVSYFSSRVAADETSSGRRHSSTGIPNPIRRMYPDRKYRPTLVSAKAAIRPAHVEIEDRSSADDDRDMAVAGRAAATAAAAAAATTASSPLPSRDDDFGESHRERRSFSIGDLLTTGPQPRWRRPEQTRSKTNPGGKLVRRGRQRIVSAPQAAMGNRLSRDSGTDSDRPSKRRILTDTEATPRSTYSSSSSSKNFIDPEANNEIQLHLSSSRPPSQHFNTNHPPDPETPSSEQYPPSSEQQRLPSANSYSNIARPDRISATQSEITSTLGSDSEYRSVGDESTDYQSDTVYDSYPTRTTRSSSGKRGPHIETIFDESPPQFSSGRSTRLKDLLRDGSSPGEHVARYRHSTIEEEESIVSTPVRSLHDKSVASTPSARPGVHQIFSSSPPAIPIMPDPDEIDWDAPDDEPTNRGLGVHQLPPFRSDHRLQNSVPFPFGPALQLLQSASTDTTPLRRSANGDRANLFDWSEVQPSPSHNNSPPRPRTVHGKKDQDSRGGRSVGRRAPSGMHARSHSVPVVPDVDGKRNNVVANKFGTWGVGSKAVTEDWNEDFEFDEQTAPTPEDLGQDGYRIDSGLEIFVPKSIREQQENVVANIGLLREWGLLIEELKELRIRAVALDMMNGTHAQAWQEVDAMIELADQETDESTLEPRRSPPSSPGFDDSAFEAPLPNIANATHPRETAVRPPHASPSVQDEEAPGTKTPSAQPMTPQQSSTGRPRQDSEAVARSVIEALQSKRSVSDPTTLTPVPPTKKVPFDTATLRHIVPYVSGLTRKVKGALRETEGLYLSPNRRSPPSQTNGANRRDSFDEGDEADGPLFCNIFHERAGPAQNSPERRRSRRDEVLTDHSGFEEPMTIDQRGDLARRLQNMNFPHQ